MQVRRLLCKRISHDRLFFYTVLTIGLLIYVCQIRSSRYSGIWSTIKSDVQKPFNNDLIWHSRVSESCKGKADIVLTESKAKAKTFVDNLGLIGVVRNTHDKHVRDEGYKHHAFNALVSNKIGPFREALPDTRHKVCRNSTYNLQELPTASIVMCFYNEHKMTLIRSLKSVLARTPLPLLKEIILIDDFSDLPELEFFLPSDLQTQMQYEKLVFVRNKNREGLIRSRVIGARKATGDVIVFLDSHIEVNQQWIEPLLSLIHKENSTIAVPVIDLINPDTFEYTSSPLVRGGFNWGLHYKWENLPQGTLKNESDFKGPFISPTMAGGLFAVKRKYFKIIGEYDLGMDIWGGENLEISFRVWQCGGSIKIVPCSRVGHIFRKRRPYSAPDGANTMVKNSLRLANVWMDDYKEYYLQHEKIGKNYDYGDITDRLALRKRLKCHSFDWYLKNIYPELILPGKNKENSAKFSAFFQPWHSRKRNYVKSYMIRLADTELCVSVLESKVKGFWKKGSEVFLTRCQGTNNQIWYETDKSEIILDKLFCLEAAADAEVKLNKCHEMLGDQQWRHAQLQNSPLYNMATGTCLRAQEIKEGSKVLLDLCTKKSINAWDFSL